MENTGNQKQKLRHFISLEDMNVIDLKKLLADAVVFKRGGKAGNVGIAGEVYPLSGKMIAMLFSKSSTRTRLAFERSIVALGGVVTFLNAGDIQLSRGEPLSDTLRVLSSYVEGVVIRTNDHQQLEETVKHHASVPVINALTDLYHPTEALADAMTMGEVLWQKQGKDLSALSPMRLKETFADVFTSSVKKTVKACYVGDANNVSRSFALVCHLLGMPCVIATPDGENFPNLARCFFDEGSSVSFTSDPKVAAENADFIYTDTWVSMGNEKHQQQQRQKLRPYAVDKALVSLAKKDYVFLHCLPAYRGQEVAPEIIDGKHSYVFQQSENRLHTIKALLNYLYTAPTQG